MYSLLLLTQPPRVMGGERREREENSFDTHDIQYPTCLFYSTTPSHTPKSTAADDDDDVEYVEEWV